MIRLARSGSWAASLAASLAAVVVAALALPACTNPVDTSPNVFDGQVADGAAAADASGPGDATATTPDATVDCGCMAVGQVFRFDTLTLLSLDGGPHPAIPQLNARWSKDIANFELNVYFIITEIGATAPDGSMPVVMRALNGAEIAGAADGDQCQLPDTAVTFHLIRNGCALTMTERAGVNIYTGSSAVPKNCGPSLDVPNTIPVRQVLLAFEMNRDCSGVHDGRVLEAGIPKAVLENVCTCLGDDAARCVGTTTTPGCDACPGTYFNLATLLKTINRGVAPTYNCRTADGAPSVCVEAAFSAAAVPSGLPAACMP